jgi:hypothetical protein
MLDQEAYEHGKHTRDLEWFRPPERKTLRSLCVVLPELANLVCSWNLSEPK